MDALGRRMRRSHAQSAGGRGNRLVCLQREPLGHPEKERQRRLLIRSGRHELFVGRAPGADLITLRGELLKRADAVGTRAPL
jgi:hypothetical protein